MDRLRDLFALRFGSVPDSIAPLSADGSNRKYYRLGCASGSYIGVVGTDADENRAFVEEARHFHASGLPVPEVLAVSEDYACYIQSDLGDVLLYDMVAKAHQDGEFSDRLQDLLCRTAALLPRLQMEGARGLDFSVCYPEPEFSRRMILFDLNYFKYCFLKSSGLEFNEVKLQDDFERLADDLLAASVLKDRDGREYQAASFMYRDCNSRNVMICGGQPYFIDFQGGRRGPVHYDVASFIWHARSAYPETLKEKMLDAYLDAMSKYVDVDRADFMNVLRKFILFRTMQVLGAYGFRGWMEHKAKFVVNIPPTIDHLKELVQAGYDSYPYLTDVLRKLTVLPRFADRPSADGRLEVRVMSFSFKKGIPADPSGNGGGYVFDCRSIHNPGRYEQYRKLTGRDDAVIRFLEDDGEITGFLEHVYGVVDPHVETYLRRGFTSLNVSFGCTGGQHRSVYCAEHLACHLASRYPQARIRMIHREQGIEQILGL